MAEALLTWLSQQLPAVVIMGIVIYFLYKLFQSERKRNQKLSDDVIKLSTLWEEKAAELGEEDKGTKAEIISLLHEIKGLIMGGKGKGDGN